MKMAVDRYVSISRLLLSFLLLLSCTPSSTLPDRSQFYALLEETAKGDESGSHPMDKLFDLRREGKDLDNQYVALLDYRLGSASSAILEEFISKRGATVLPLLRQKVGTPLLCDSRYSKICMPSIAERDRRIAYLIDALERGKVLCADESDCN
jgi:hypothetical protein